MSRFFQQIFAIKSRSRRKTEQMQKCCGPIFSGGMPQLFYGTLLVRPTVHRLTKCGGVPFAVLRQRSLAMKWNAEFAYGR